MYGEIMRDQREATGTESDRLHGVWGKVVEAAERALAGADG